MPELGKAYVQIIPSAQGISGSISSAIGGEAESAGNSAGNSLGGSLVSTLKNVIVAAGIGTMIKETLDVGGQLQQSFGGLDTLYGDAAEGAKKYAMEAQKAGISANDYAEQAVSFGASLKQAYGGDTTAAMEAANTAILDMTDNAAKMGTPLESIQNAYQGFAKQNYTMLDNLKLGYGGTKEEMQRLLDDATKLSGVEYDMTNLGDVYSAIHVIQEDLGLTGVAADEAAETFSGSLGAMKAAGENLMANLALGEDITPSLNALRESVSNFVFNNLFPMIGNIFSALPDLLSGLSSMIIQSLNVVTNNADELVQQGIDIVVALVSAIVEAAPYLLEAAVSLVTALGNAFINADWAAIGTKLLTSLQTSIDDAALTILGNDGMTVQSFINGIMSKIGDVLTVGKDILGKVYDGITASLPKILESGVQIILQLVNGILSNLPNLITTAYQLVTQFTAFLLQNLPTILQAGADLLLGLVNGIISNLPEIVIAAVQGVTQFITTIAGMLPQVLQQGIEIIFKLIAGLVQAIPDLIAAIPQIISAIVDTIMEVDWLQLGLDILDGIAKGISNGVSNLISALWGAVSDAIQWVKDQLGIKSPSKLMADVIGKNMALGIGVGFEDNIPDVDMADAVLDTTGSMETAVQSGVVNSADRIDYMAIYEAVKAGAEAANLIIDLDGREVTRTLKGLGVAMA